MTDTDGLEQTPEGIWVITGETHINGWVREHKRLDHDQFTIPLATRHIHPGTVAIDVGANVGTHTVAYLNKVGPSGSVIAYEPNPIAARCLRLNCPTADIREMALGIQVGFAGFRPWLDNVGMSHLDKEGPIQVGITTLDENVVLEPSVSISFIKIDAEGSEPDILRGGEVLIQEHRPVILLEVNHWALANQRHTLRDITFFMETNRYGMTILPERNNWDSAQYELLCIPMT
jgi:FkbM family methyltransferase